MAPQADVVVVGAGVLGLTSALFLAHAGYQVTIVARDLPGDETVDWASPWAGAVISPHPDAECTELQRASIKFYDRLVGQDGERGIRQVEITELYDDRPATAQIWYSNDVKNFAILPSSQLPAGVTLGYKYTGFVVNPVHFLPWIKHEIEATGKVRFIRRTLSSLAEARRLSWSSSSSSLTSLDNRGTIIINASGLGAEHLADDPAVEGVRGQTMMVSVGRCSEGDRDNILGRVVIRQGSQYTYAIPRPSSGVVILGGVSQPGNTQREADSELRTDILSRVNAMTDGQFSWVDLDRDVERDIVGFRPGRKGGIRVEREEDVIHAYGAKGLGYAYSFGVAEKVLRLVREADREQERGRL